MTHTNALDETEPTSAVDDLTSLRDKLKEGMDHERIHVAHEYIMFASRKVLDYREHRGTGRGIEIMNVASSALKHANSYLDAVVNELTPSERPF